MLQAHFIIVDHLLGLRRSGGISRRIGAQTGNLEPAVVRKCDQETFLGLDSQNIDINRGSLGLCRPHELDVLVDHEVVAEGPQDEAEARGIMSVGGALAYHLEGEALSALGNVLVVWRMVSPEA